MKKVILLTKAFPYGKIETFIEPELAVLPADIDLDIVPTHIYEEEAKRTLPQGVSLISDCAISNNVFVRLVYTLRGLFSGEFITECRTRDKLSIYLLKIIAGYLGRSLELMNKIEKKYKDVLGKESITFYSYWFLEGGHAIGLLKRKYGDCIKVVSRAHGVDVYQGRLAYGMIPGRESILPYLDRVYVCSREGRDYLSEKYSLYRDKFVCGYLGSQDFSYSIADDRENNFTIVSCARMVELKRIHLLVQALSKISTKSVHWIHMGDGALRGEIEQAIKELPSNVRVSLMGNVAHDEVMKFYHDNSVHVFVNTSSSEGLPVSIMEAISFGIPVIATDVGGTSEIVNEKTGVLLPADFEVEQLTEMIMKYVKMPSEQYVDARKNAREFWEKTFSASKNYAEFYREITEMHDENK